jgi:hypothetical protein
MSKTIWVVVTY